MKTNEEILNEWAERVAPDEIIRDGVIDESMWRNAPKKVLVLLKEGYTKKTVNGNTICTNKGWDLCKDLRNACSKNEFYGRSLREVAYWVNGIINASNSFFPSLRHLKDEDVINSFSSSSVINLKKTPGNTSSCWNDLKAELEKCKDLLREQIEAIGPDIVVCGNTWSLVKNIYQNAIEKCDQVFYVPDKEFLFVDFCHPANRASRSMKYYSLESLLRRAGVI